jgi:Cdc6-like AAA superfamily ATPase
VTSIRCITEETKTSIDKLHLSDHQLKVINWLHAPDPSTNYNKALNQRHEGSGLWLLHNQVFETWKTQQNSFLWLYGIPGCGKTILSSTVIQALENTGSHRPLLYFYFDFNDKEKQTHHNMLSALLSQLYSTSSDSSQMQALDSLFKSCQDGCRQPSTQSLCEVFLHILDQLKEVWIVLDALDECDTRKGLLPLIRNVLQSDRRNVHLLVTSRPEHDIESEITGFAHEDNMIKLQSSLTTNDIRDYVHTRVRKDDDLKRWRSRPKVQDEIETQLMKKANGM